MSQRRTDQVHELEALEQLAVLVLEAVGLVDDDAAPLDGVQLGAAAQDHLKRGDDGLELVSASQNPTLETKRGEMAPCEGGGNQTIHFTLRLLVHDYDRILMQSDLIIDRHI